MEPLQQYRFAQELEGSLGDPADAANLFSFQRSVELDESETLPRAQCDELTRRGLHRFYIPKAEGGAMDSLEEMFAAWRAVARRDVAVMVTHMISWFGVLPVWIAGTPAQKRRAAALIESGVTVAYGLTERAHGADLRASEVEAVRGPSGFLLRGEKWLCNAIGKESDALILFAKTAVGAGTSWSLFLVDKRALPAGTFANLPKIKTLGIRAAPIAAVRFDGAPVPEDALVGGLGGGLEVGVKGLMLTRVFMASLSMGAVDTALRLVVEWARKRALYGMPVIDIPHARTSLLGSFLDVLISDCVSTTSVRAINGAPDQLASWHAVTKYFVPVTVEQTVRDLSVVLGARFYLREEFQHGLFQKILRDVMVVPLFDGSTTVVLSSLVSQLRILLGKAGANGANGAKVAGRERLKKVCALAAPSDPFDPSRLGLAMDADIMLDGLHDCVAELEALPDDAARALATMAKLACADHDANMKKLKERIAQRTPHFSMSEEGFEIARRHCLLHATAATLNVWLANRDTLGAWFAQGEWCVLAVRRLLTRLGHAGDDLPSVSTAGLYQELLRRYDENLTFSLVPLKLPGQPA